MADKDSIVTLLCIPCIPTTRGIQQPSAAYFANVVIFEDLPIIALPTTSKGMDQLLAALGVRRTVEVGLLPQFRRMIRS